MIATKKLTPLPLVRYRDVGPSRLRFILGLAWQGLQQGDFDIPGTEKLEQKMRPILNPPDAMISGVIAELQCRDPRAGCVVRGQG